MVKIEYATIKYKGREIQDYIVKELKTFAAEFGIRSTGLKKADLVREIGKYLYEQRSTRRKSRESADDKSDSDADSESDTEPDAADSDSEPGAKSDADSDSESDAEPDAEPGAKSDADSDSESDAEPDAEPGAKSDADSDSESDAAESDSEPDAESDADESVDVELSPVASMEKQTEQPSVDVTVPGIIGVQNVIATPGAADIIEPAVVADPVDIVALLREIQEVKIPDAGERKDIQRSIYHCLGLDTGITTSNKFEFNNDVDGMYVFENDDTALEDGELI